MAGPGMEGGPSPDSALSCLTGATTAPQSLVAGNCLPPTKYMLWFSLSDLSQAMVRRWDSFPKKEIGGRVTKNLGFI